MPRWKALPEELDPQVREFAGQLRRLVDRSGLSLGAVAERTGCTTTSWELYLDGGLLPPRGAVVSLAEVTGAGQDHLTTMWELAERAWSRSEPRHDMTMEATRIARARAALGEFGPPPVQDRAPADPVTPPGPAWPGMVADGPGGPGSAGAPDPGPSPAGGRLGSRRKVALFLAGLIGSLTLMAGALFLTDQGGDAGRGKRKAAPSVRPATSAPVLPAGVRCGGADCTGKDPEEMGCGGRFAATASSVTVDGRLVEVRYSRTCAAAWARITGAAAGDSVRIRVGPTGQDSTVGPDTDAYTPMAAVKQAAEAKACVTLASGAAGCTTPGRGARSG